MDKIEVMACFSEIILIFVVSSPETRLDAHYAVAIFIAANEAFILTDKGLSNHTELLHSCCDLSLARRGEIAFFVFKSAILPSLFIKLI